MVRKSTRETKVRRTRDDRRKAGGESVVEASYQQPSGDAALERRIAERAYELYLERGKEDGHAMDDWVQAEREVTGKV